MKALTLTPDDETKFRESVRLLGDDGTLQWNNRTAMRLLATLDAERADRQAEAVTRMAALDAERSAGVPVAPGTTYISDRMVIGARCLYCHADAMDHSCPEEAPHD